MPIDKQAGLFPAQNKYYSTKRDNSQQATLNNLIEAVSSISEEAVLTRLQLVEENQKLEVSVLVADDAELSTLCDIRCSKTGQPLDAIDLQTISKLLEVCGRDKLIYMLAQRSISAVSPMWVYTDCEALDTLSELEPIAYFVYAASSILTTYQPGFNTGQKPNERDLTARLQFNGSKSQLWDNLQSIPMADIIEANEIMRRYLTFINTTFATQVVKFSNKNLATLEIAAFIIEVQSNIEKVVRHEYKKGRIKSALTYADIVDLKIFYQGHSNFRGQRNLSKMNETDLILHALRPFMTEVAEDFYHESRKPWQIRNMQSNKTKIKEHTGGVLNLKIAESKTNDKLPIKQSFADLLSESRKKNEGDI